MTADVDGIVTCQCYMRAGLDEGEHWILCEKYRSLGTCQQCGRYTTDRYCFATDGCKELGGADVL